MRQARIGLREASPAQRQVEVVPGRHLVSNVAGTIIVVAHRGTTPVSPKSRAASELSALVEIVRRTEPQRLAGTINQLTVRRRLSVDFGIVGRIFLPPMPQQDESRWDRVKETALGHKHRQWNAFPGDVIDVLIIDHLEVAQKKKAGDSAIKKKTGDCKCAPPTIKSIEGRY